MEPFLFVVDTTSYAGNFERDMCAAITGQIGDCEVGQGEAAEFQERFPEEYNAFERIVSQVIDEHGCYRPVIIYPTPGFYNDGMGGAYTDADDPEKVRARYIKAVEKYHLPLLKDAEAKGWATSAADHRQTIEKAKTKGPGKYSAYQSVGIYFSEKPSAEQIAFMKARAEEYAQQNSLTITGYRLVENKLMVNEEAV